MSEPGGWQQPEGRGEGADHPTGPSGGAPVVPPGWGPPPGSPSTQAATGTARPGIIPLRPLRLGELYDGAFRAVRANPGPVLGWSAVVVVIMVTLTTVTSGLLQRGLLDLVSDPALFDTSSGAPDWQRLRAGLDDNLPSALTAFGVAVLASLVGQAVLSGVVTASVSGAVLGRRVSGAALWAQVRPRIVPLVLLSLLSGLIVLVVVGVLLAPGLVLLGTGSGSTGGVVAAAGVLVLGALVAVVVAVLLQVRLLLSTPALVLEPQPVGRAIGRSWRLTRRGFWRVLGIYLLTSIGLYIAAAVVSGPFSLLGSAIAGAVGDPTSTGTMTATLVISAVGDAIASTLTLPLTAAVTALLYIDQRMRIEGLDVDLAAAAAALA